MNVFFKQIWIFLCERSPYIFKRSHYWFMNLSSHHKHARTCGFLFTSNSGQTHWAFRRTFFKLDMNELATISYTFSIICLYMLDGSFKKHSEINFPYCRICPPSAAAATAAVNKYLYWLNGAIVMRAWDFTMNIMWLWMRRINFGAN